jgi:4-hydroxyphenylpyruvate dioxygenase-like putative hemolysin
LYSQNINRIDHVIILVTLDNLDRAAAEFSELLALTMEGPFDTGGLRVYIDWAAGIELYAPTDPAIAVEQTQFLAEHGEGVFRIVFGVRDRSAAIARAEELGIDARTIDGFTVNERWQDSFERIDEAPLSRPVHGVRINFGEIVPKAAHA